jgi:hypothetical protein
VQLHGGSDEVRAPAENERCGPLERRTLSRKIVLEHGRIIGQAMLKRVLGACGSTDTPVLLSAMGPQGAAGAGDPHQAQGRPMVIVNLRRCLPR